MALAEKVLIFFALFQKLELTEKICDHGGRHCIDIKEKICSPCITISSDGGINDDLAGTYRYIHICCHFLLTQVTCIFISNSKVILYLIQKFSIIIV